MSRDLGAGLQVEAVDAGIQSQVSRASTNEVYKIDPAMLSEVRNDIRQKLTDDTLSEEEQQSQAVAELEALKDFVSSNAKSRGFSKIDPSFSATIRELELMIMGQDDSKRPARPVLPPRTSASGSLF